MSAIVPFDHNLVTKSVNFHGHNLLKQLVSDNAAQIHSIKLQDIDYKVYQSRAVEIRNLGCSRVQEMIEFIASKSDILLVSQMKMIKPPDTKNDGYKDCYKHQLPLEYFMHTNKYTRISELFNTVQKGDILLTEVNCYVDGGCAAALKILAFDEGKHRYFSDFRITDVKVMLKFEDTLVSKADEDKLGRWMVGTRLRVEVLDVVCSRLPPCIIVGTLGVTLQEKSKDKVKLGKIQLQDLPPILSVTPDPSLSFLSQCITKTESYNNPQSIRQLASEFGIDLHAYSSLMSSFRGGLIESEKPSSLRKVQVCKWAHKSVADGVTHFKKGQHEEAFQCLNKALQIDQENVEAFVAKGALLANLGRYEKAIEDFEKALKYNPQHINARKYMCETLVELGKQYEEKDKLNEAEKCYSRCLELNQDHTVAKEGLSSVSSKLGTKPEVMKLLTEEIVEKEDSVLEDFLQIEMELNKKKAEEEMQLLSQVKEENNLPCTLMDSTKQEVKEEKETSLSPLSQKLAIQHSLWAAPPPNINPTMSFITTSTEATLPSHTTQDSSINIFSNPPPNWPIPDITKPPPLVVGYSEDACYKARVEQFLKELETRSHQTDKKRPRSRDKTSQKQKRSRTKERRKHKKRRESSASSSSGSGSSSSSSSGSSSDDSDSSKSSRSSSSVSSGNNIKKHKKNIKKKKRKQHEQQKQLQKQLQKQQQRQQQKQQQKQQQRQQQKQQQKQKQKQIEKDRRPEIETKLPDMVIPDFKDLEKKLLDYYKKMEAMKAPQEPLERKEAKDEYPDLTLLKRTTHPAFLDHSDDSEETPMKPGPNPNSALAELKRERTSVDEAIRKIQQTKKPASSSNDGSNSSSRSRSSSSSRSKGRRRSRSRSRGRRRSRSRSRKRTSPSRSSRHRKRRSSRSHSRGRRHRHRSKSNPSPRHRRSRSKQPLPIRLPAKKAKSPPFGYYHNKPFYTAPTKDEIKEGVASALPSLTLQSKHTTHAANPPLPLKSPKSPPPPPIKFEIKKLAALQAKTAIERHLASNTKGLSVTTKDNTRNTRIKEAQQNVPSPDPSSRFGKWARDGVTKKKAANGQGKAPAPGGSLDQFENFLKEAKQKSIELMKERNKAFLKPQLD